MFSFYLRNTFIYGQYWFGVWLYLRNTFIYGQLGTVLVWCLVVFEKQLYLWTTRNYISLVFGCFVDVNDIKEKLFKVVIISTRKYGIFVGLMFWCI